MFIPLNLIELPCKGLLSHTQEIFLKIPKNPKFHSIVSRRSVCKNCINSEVLLWLGADFLAIFPDLYYVCALEDVPCTTTYLLKSDVFECPKSSCLFSAVTEHGLATHLSMTHNEKLVQNFDGEDDERSTTKERRDEFVPGRLLGNTERVRDDRSTFAQNDANFNGSTLEAEKNLRSKQLRYDEHVVDLNTLRELSEEDEMFKFLRIQIIELERYLLVPQLKEFYLKLRQQKTNLYSLISEFSSV